MLVRRSRRGLASIEVPDDRYAGREHHEVGDRLASGVRKPHPDLVREKQVPRRVRPVGRLDHGGPAARDAIELAWAIGVEEASKRNRDAVVEHLHIAHLEGV